MRSQRSRREFGFAWAPAVAYGWLSLGILASCQPGSTVTPRAIGLVRGKAMGTSYTVKYGPSEARHVEGSIEAELTSFNRVFSTYDPQSEISRFNHHASTEPFAASEGFAAVVRRARDIAERTGGAFDPTVGPVLRLYGFGPDGETPKDLPADEILAAARAKTGWQKFAVADDGKITKQIPELELDLNAMAKGTGVDRIAKLLDDLGIPSYMVEIGGEVRCRGRKPDGKPWTLGVADPTRPGQPEFTDKVPLVDRAMATSGSYLQFRKFGKARVHHILDPRTGKNAASKVLSVTVIANTCELADALATALMVLGPDEGNKVLEGFAADDVRVLFLLVGEKGIERQVHRW